MADSLISEFYQRIKEELILILIKQQIRIE